MMTKRVLKIFVGYQLNGEFHEPGELKRILSAIVVPDIEGHLHIEVKVKFGDKFETGENLFSQIEEAICQSEIAIFDISENNPNVLIEVGLAYGAKKFIILLKKRGSGTKYKVPSDIGAFIYLPYDELESIIQDIISSIRNYVDNKVPSHFYFKELWGFKPKETVYIICPELAMADARQNPELNEYLYLAKYGDIDSFLVVFASLSKLFPDVNIKYCTSKEFNQHNNNYQSDNLILVGGPDYNEITRYYLEKKKIAPFEFVVTDEETEEVGIKHKDFEEVYMSLFETDDELACIKDYGFFIKAKNPVNPRRKIFMINGLHTYGVYGAAKCFSLHEDNESEVAEKNCRDVIYKIGDSANFAILFEVNCMCNRVEIPSIKSENLIVLD